MVEVRMVQRRIDRIRYAWVWWPNATLLFLLSLSLQICLWSKSFVWSDCVGPALRSGQCFLSRWLSEVDIPEYSMHTGDFKLRNLFRRKPAEQVWMIQRRRTCGSKRGGIYGRIEDRSAKQKLICTDSESGKMSPYLLLQPFEMLQTLSGTMKPLCSILCFRALWNTS